MHTRSLPCTLALAALLLTPAATSAQDADPPEERAAAEARARAEEEVGRAFEAVAAYGRGQPVGPATLRGLALDRLAREDGEEEEAEPAEGEWVDLRAAAEELRAVREALRARLARLDPERYRPRREPAARPEPVLLRILDVGDLVIAPGDHVAPSVGLGSTYGGGAGGGTLMFASGEDWTPGVGIDADKLHELIESTLGELVTNEAIEYREGRLVTRLGRSRLAQVERLLALLRSERGGLVEVEVRLYALAPGLFARLRGQAGALTDEAELTLERAGPDEARLLGRHRVVAHDGQRVCVVDGHERAFTADVEMNQTGVVPVPNPVVNALREGLAAEVRPVVDRGRGQVLLDVALSLTEVLGVDVVDAQGVDVERPRLAIARTSSTAIVPLGRGALLGGTLRVGEDRSPVTSVVYVRARLAQGGR